MSTNASPLITLSAAARQISDAVGLEVSPSAVRRWTVKGTPDPCHKGRRVYLETKRLGGRIYTTAEWVNRFVGLYTGTEPRERKRRRREGESPARQILREKFGFRYDDAPSRQMPDVPPASGDSGAVPDLLPVGSLCDRDTQSDGGATDRSGADDAAAQQSPKRLREPLGRALGRATKRD